jgi:hypothetical protein
MTDPADLPLWPDTVDAFYTDRACSPRLRRHPPLVGLHLPVAAAPPPRHAGGRVPHHTHAYLADNPLRAHARLRHFTVRL